jgi:predicted ArsR family transcriptional regulator
MDRDTRDLGQRLEALASLGDPVRRALYLHVASQSEPVSRDEAATAAGITRTLAAYHLDKLAAAGLLDVRFERRTGRAGPGAGRPAKLYLRAREPIEIAVPARSYELIAQLLATAVDADDAGAAQSALSRAAHDYGLGLRPASRRTGNRTGSDTPGDAMRVLRALLGEHGFEPYEDNGAVRLRNCPFDRLASQHRALVCGANLALIEGLIEGQKLTGVQAFLDPRSGECCVVTTVAGPAREAREAWSAG